MKNSQKQEDLLSLALSSNEEERIKSGIMNVGILERNRWEIIVKYHGNIEAIASEEIEVEILLGGYAIITLPEEYVESLAELPEIEYMEKPKSLIYNLYEAKQSSCLSSLISQPEGLTGKGVILAVIDSGERVIIMSS